MRYYERYGSWRKRPGFFSYILVGLIGAIIGGLFISSLLTGFPFREGKGLLWQGNLLPLEDDDREDVVSVVEKAGPSVVMITTREERTVDFFFDTVVEQVEGLGSGVIFDDAGHVMTNNHVVAKALEIAVVLPDGRKFAGDSVQLVGRDPLSDLAILRIRGDDLPVATLGASQKLRVGELAVAIGNPYGLDHTVTSGIISALGRPLMLNEEYGIILRDLIQTDAPINPGNSGGPLLNSKAEVVGINTAIIGAAQSIGFAIPIHKAKGIAEEIMEHGRVRRPWLGILGEELTAGIPVEGNVDLARGIGVRGVIPGSPAERAGIRPGDIIISMDGEDIQNLGKLKALLKEMKIGERHKLTILRRDVTIEATLLVEEMPVEVMDEILNI